MTEMRIVAALGDSITAGTPYWDPDPAVRESIGTDFDERHQWPYWAERRFPSIRIRNHGVNLERTDQIAMRLEKALLGVQLFVVQGGINDVVQERPAEYTVANLRAMIGRVKEVGLPVAVTTVLPWNNGFPRTDSVIRALNSDITVMAQQEGATLLDFFGALEDPERPGRMRDDWTSDGNHPSVEGHRRLGELAFRVP